MKLYERLVGAQPLHASPAEHQATPDVFCPETYAVTTPEDLTDEQKAQRVMPISIELYGQWNHPEQHGNLPGWRQFRKMLPGERVAQLPEGYVYKRKGE